MPMVLRVKVLGAGNVGSFRDNLRLMNKNIVIVYCLDEIDRDLFDDLLFVLLYFY